MRIFKVIASAIGALILVTAAAYVLLSGDARPYCDAGVLMGGPSQPVMYAMPTCNLPMGTDDPAYLPGISDQINGPGDPLQILVVEIELQDIDTVRTVTRDLQEVAGGEAWLMPTPYGMPMPG